MNELLNIIQDEMYRQKQIWGEQNHSDSYWLAILMEEIGEVAKAIIEGGYCNWPAPDPNIDIELIQAIAVGVSWLECRKRRKESDKEC